MIFAIDFDGTIVRQDRDYEDTTTPLEFVPGAEQALRAIKRAGHVILVYSARTNAALLEDWRLNPLWKYEIVPLDLAWWESHREVASKRFEQMTKFVHTQLKGVVDAIDLGEQGKPTGIDVFIDDRNWNAIIDEDSWNEIAEMYGEPEDDSPETVRSGKADTGGVSR